jgi:hypothetical protein
MWLLVVDDQDCLHYKLLRQELLKVTQKWAAMKARG